MIKKIHHTAFDEIKNALDAGKHVTSKTGKATFSKHGNDYILMLGAMPFPLHNEIDEQGMCHALYKPKDIIIGE